MAKECEPFRQSLDTIRVSTSSPQIVQSGVNVSTGLSTLRADSVLVVSPGTLATITITTSNNTYLINIARTERIVIPFAVTTAPTITSTATSYVWLEES